MAFGFFKKGIGRALIAPMTGGAVGFAGQKIFQKGAKKADINPYMAAGNEAAMQSFQSMRDFAAQGPGAADVGAYTGGQRDLASMLQQYSQGGFMPGQGDINQANDLAGQLFQAQRVAQTQAFQDQLTQANRQAALSGRGVNDPILKAKLAQEQTRQGSLLQAQQGAFAAQYAQELPGQRLQYAQQRVGVLGDLAGQAWQNQGNVFNAAGTLRGYQDQNRGGGFMGGLNALLNVGGKVAGIAGSVIGAAAGNPMAAAGLGQQLSGITNSFQMPQLGSSAGFGQQPNWSLMGSSGQSNPWSLSGGGGGVDLSGANPYGNSGAMPSFSGASRQPTLGNFSFGDSLKARGGY